MHHFQADLKIHAKAGIYQADLKIHAKAGISLSKGCISSHLVPSKANISIISRKFYFMQHFESSWLENPLKGEGIVLHTYVSRL